MYFSTRTRTMGTIAAIVLRLSPMLRRAHELCNMQQSSARCAVAIRVAAAADIAGCHVCWRAKPAHDHIHCVRAIAAIASSR